MTIDYAFAEQQARRLLQAGSLEQAESLLRKVLATGAEPLFLWRLLAQAIRPQGKIAETLAIQKMLVERSPGDMAQRFDLAETLLLSGDFKRGWREYRFRYSMPHTEDMGRRMQQPRWEGQPLEGKTLLVHDEQGYGDTFQFLRLVALVRQRSGARVVLEINPDSLSLAQRSLGSTDVIARGTLPPPFDYHCELLSLPLAMQLQWHDLPGPMPYLRADPARLKKWRDRLAALPRPLVGLVWAGRPSHSNDGNRSMALADLAPLGQSGATLLSLQKGPAAEQARTAPDGMQLLSLGDEIHDFEDTAAILTVIDLLVSVDSAPVHLAGALGRPAWVMLPFVPDWRWLMAREDTPWYPGMRLWRQQQRGQWPAVVNDIAARLREWQTVSCA